MTTDFKFYGGKFEGRLLSSMKSSTEIGYLQWILKNLKLKVCKEVLIKKHLEKFPVK